MYCLHGSSVIKVCEYRDLSMCLVMVLKLVRAIKCHSIHAYDPLFGGACTHLHGGDMVVIFRVKPTHIIIVIHQYRHKSIQMMLIPILI